MINDRDNNNEIHTLDGVKTSDKIKRVFDYDYLRYKPCFSKVLKEAYLAQVVIPAVVVESYLTFSSDEPFSLSVINEPYESYAAPSWDGILEYSTDTSTWTEWDGLTSLSSNNENELYLRGIGNTTFYSDFATIFQIESTSGVACSGNIEMLLDYQTVLNGNHPEMGIGCFYRLFEDCSIISAPELPATTLAERCYERMFTGTSIVVAPELPATVLSDGCYQEMFRGCTALSEAPELSATILSDYCYTQMFHGCTSLVVAPELPATTLAVHCYGEMFEGCISLTTAPELPVTTLAEGCYSSMFRDCTSLETVSTLPATTLADYCYSSMFEGCTAIKLSETQIDEYSTPYRIPVEGAGITGINSLYQMFSNTGGTFTGTPIINTTYYIAPAL